MQHNSFGFFTYGVETKQFKQGDFPTSVKLPYLIPVPDGTFQIYVQMFLLYVPLTNTD